MGSMIRLAVGRLEVDWGKNNFFKDHSALFQNTDVTEVPYYYAGDEYYDGREAKWKVITERKKGLSKPLRLVLDRVELLGHTLETCRSEFASLAEMHSLNNASEIYEQLCQALTTIDANNVSLDYGIGEEDFGEFFREQIAPRLKISARDKDNWFSLGECMENLSPYTIIRLLGENADARDLPVIWAYSDLTEGGYAAEADFVKSLSPAETVLVVTEGSSDAAILKHALALLKPHIADFFTFVDMEEGYPFRAQETYIGLFKA